MSIANTPEGELVATTCTWVANKTGNRCRKAPIAGTTRCREHGGKGTLAMVEYNRARSIKHVRPEWEAEYAELVDSPHLLDFRKEIAAARLHLAHNLSAEEPDYQRIESCMRTLVKLTERHTRTVLDATDTLTRAEAVALVTRVRAVVSEIIAMLPEHQQDEARAKLDTLRQ